VTLEGGGALAALAEGHHQGLGLENVRVVTGRFKDTLATVLNSQKPVDYLFIDGHHDEKATLSYFEQAIPFLADRAVIVFDDISWSAGMKRAWRAIEVDRRVKMSIDLRQLGVCLVDARLSDRKAVRIPLL
jgi:predicted O-methyltransferase YrrM